MGTQSGEKRITYIDLFAGAGGLSEGFSSVGYEPVAHVEMNEDACETLKTRACYYYHLNNGNLELYYQYLRGEVTKEQYYDSVPETILNSVICETMGESTMSSIFDRIDHNMRRAGIEAIDLLVGGPPCQAYSQVGRSRKCMDNDPRNRLYELYFQVLQKYQPKVFVFENVPGIFTAGKGAYLKAILQGFDDLGYDLEYKIVNASDYGVLQNRKRVIVVGWKKGTHYHYPKMRIVRKQYTVRELLEDLPHLQPGEHADQYSDEHVDGYLREMGIRTEEDVLTWHVTRKHVSRDREIYRQVISAWNNGHQRLRYSDLPPELTTHRNKKSFLDRFKVVADDLEASQTMVAHISKDGHYYIHPDIEQARSISVREAARIQSFPDNFYFEGSRTAAFTQIGNAVPPLMAKAIASALKEQFVED